jgi:hypothetical protein
MLYGGCSLFCGAVTSQLTAGKLPARASVTKRLSETTFDFQRLE